MAISNKGQLSKVLSSSYKPNKITTTTTPPVEKPLPDYSVTNKKLSSKSWVNVPNKQKGQPLKDTGDYKCKIWNGLTLITYMTEKSGRVAELEKLIYQHKCLRYQAKCKGNRDKRLMYDRILKSLIKKWLPLVQPKKKSTTQVTRERVVKNIKEKKYSPKKSFTKTSLCCSGATQRATYEYLLI